MSKLSDEERHNVKVSFDDKILIGSVNPALVEDGLEIS